MEQLKEATNGGEWEISQGDVELYETIGKGSFGIVRKARWRCTPVAVKMLNDIDALVMDEFARDFVSLTKLHHPNIVQLLGVCTTTPLMICMELLPCSLQDCIGKMSYAVMKDISVDIARALAYIHNRRPTYIIHRDLKPSNVLITPSNKAKLTDFGLSMFREDRDGVYNMTGETGTYRYMAPEVLRHESYNNLVDIWSFGMVLYHMFESMPPYATLGRNEMIQKIATYVTPRFENTPKSVRNVIETCWGSPAERMGAIELTGTLENARMPNEYPKSGCFSFWRSR